MASSGWQGQKDIQTSKYPHMALNLNVWDVNHSGTNVTFKATVRAIVTSGNLYYNNVGVSLTGGGSISKNMNPVSSGGYVDFGTYSCTVSNVATGATTCNVTASLNAGTVASGSATWTLSFSASSTPPSGITASIADITDTSASINVNLTSYGTPASEANRYIEAAVLGQNSYGASYRYTAVKAVDSSVITVNNSSSANPASFSIKGNTQYWYGAYATNTVTTAKVVSGNFVTRPAYISNVSVVDDKRGNITFTANHAEEGTATTVTTKYSLDGGEWVDASDTFTLSLSGEHTVSVKRVSAAGETPAVTVSVVPFTAVALYGSVENKSKKVRKLYGPVDNKSKEIKKLYASVNGKSKLIYTA